MIGLTIDTDNCGSCGNVCSGSRSTLTTAEPVGMPVWAHDRHLQLRVLWKGMSRLLAVNWKSV